MKEYDFLIIGSGIIGTAIARHLKREEPSANIAILEKENEAAYHASGRNSGVLHAGFYYTSDSLKARFTKEGSQQLKAYCNENNLPILNCGKLVAAQSEQDLTQIDELLNRAKHNDVELHEVTEKEAYELEPNLKFFERALWSPSTSVVNPKQIVQHMVNDLKQKGVDVFFDTIYKNRLSNKTISTNKGSFKSKYLINCAGLYADRIASDFGFSNDYKILPFKGLYLKSNKPLHNFLKRHIYPVPNLKNPFLGVHFTKTLDGYVKIGPTAIPAFWREHYEGFNRFSFMEFLEITGLELNLMLHSGFDFTALAVEEFKKYSKKYLRGLAENLVKKMDNNDFVNWGPAGIRAQLLNVKTKKLELDYLFEGDKESFHVLNAVSPAFTSSLPFSEFICNKIFSLINDKQYGQ